MEYIKKYRGKIVLLGIIVLLTAVYFFVEPVNTTMNTVFKMFAGGDFTVVKEFVASYGVYAALVSFALMILQSVAAPLPAFLLTFANANLFGWWQGAILSWTSAMAGAAMCFYIARVLGRDVVAKITSKAGVEQIDEFLKNTAKTPFSYAVCCPLCPSTMSALRQGSHQCLSAPLWWPQA